MTQFWEHCPGPKNDCGRCVGGAIALGKILGSATYSIAPSTGLCAMLCRC